MRIGGVNCVENAHVSVYYESWDDTEQLGSHHTLDIDFYKPVTIEKDLWCEIDIERMKESVNIDKSADVGCILMQDGLAHICLIKNKITIVKSKIEKNISRKGRGGNDQYENVFGLIIRYD